MGRPDIPAFGLLFLTSPSLARRRPPKRSDGGIRRYDRSIEVMSESTQSGRGTLGIAERSDRRVLRVDAADNVAIALADLRQGEQIGFEGDVYELATDVPAKHKFALRPLQAGDHVVMYGVVVGKATQPIRRGERITVLNLKHDAAAYHRKDERRPWHAPDVSKWRTRTFDGYARSDGQVGTRNYWLVAPLVFCETRNIVVLKQAFEEELGFAPPQPYRRQVADLVRAYQSGAAESAGAVQAPAAAGKRIFDKA